MGIYRGPGGTGDAVNDAASEAIITVQAKDAALAAQAAAEAAQAAAELAETNAETAETNAETAETNAETAATNAANSASAASTSATNAASSASAASTSASNASTSATNAANSASAASTSASNAASSASTASTQATNASNSASAAATSATNASNSASAAATSATNAANSATAAQTARTAAELAETNAETAETNAETAETNAAASASAAASSASSASSSASSASSSASAASTSASNAASSATSASNSASTATTQATNASNSASAASTSATNASNSATAAANSATAAANSATAAQTAETNAETAETNAAASASAASTSATNASNSASAASTSATNAANSASSASTSATNASNSASAASTSATNASNSATSAANSATAAASSYDSFDDRYLGAKSSAPTLDNDGNALLTGALYYDTVSSAMKVWSGSAWLDAYASLSGALLATNNLSDLNNTATARTNLGVAIGTNVQAWDGDLDAIAAISGTSGLLKKTAANTWSLDTNTYLTSAVTSVSGTSPVSSSGGTTPTISLASGYGDTQNPYASKTANFVLASPNGSAGTPTFRAIVAADIPTLNQNTTGTASNVTGTVAIANGGTGQTTQQAALNALAATTTSGQYLRGNGTNVVMSAIQAGDVPTLNQNTTGTASNVTGTVAIANGGTGATTAPTARTNLGATTVGGNLFTLTNPSAVTFPRFNADNTVSALDAATFRTAIGAGTGNGTVTSVTGTSPVSSSGGTTPAISLASGYGDTQNPYASKTANNFLAAPNGTAGAPTFRSIVAADIPTLNQNTTGTASNVTGTVAIANGGTGATTRQDAMDALAGAVTSGQYLRGNGTDVVMSAIQAGDVPTLNQNTTGTASNVTGTVAIANGGTGQTTANAAYNALNPMTTTGDMVYEAAGGIATRLPIGTAGQVLTVSSGIPAWATASGGGFSGATTTSSATDVTLTNTSTQIQNISMTADNKFVILPNATTLTAGSTVYKIYNSGSYAFGVKNSAGDILGYSQTYGTTVSYSLTNNSTSAGIWASSLENEFINVVAGVTNAVSTESVFLTAFPNFTPLIAVQMLSTTAFIAVYKATASTVKAIGGSISGSTVTFGSAITLQATDGGMLIEDVTLAKTSSTTAVACWHSNNGTSKYAKGVSLSLSGTTLTAGTPTTLHSNDGSVATIVFTVGGTTAIFLTAGSSTDGFGFQQARAATSSGTTLTLGTAISFYGDGGGINLTGTPITSSAFVVTGNNSSGVRRSAICSVSGTTITKGTDFTGTNAGVNSSSSALISSTQAYVGQYLYTFSGTTISSIALANNAVVGLPETLIGSYYYSNYSSFGVIGRQSVSASYNSVVGTVANTGLRAVGRLATDGTSQIVVPSVSGSSLALSFLKVL